MNTELILTAEELNKQTKIFAEFFYYIVNQRYLCCQLVHCCAIKINYVAIKLNPVAIASCFKTLKSIMKL